MCQMRTLIAILSWCLAFQASVRGGEWNMFRGPNGSGIGERLQIQGDLGLDDVVWKTTAGDGGSSLVACGDKIFWTAFDTENRYLKCAEAQTGKEVWSRSIPKLRVETATPPNDPAICTPACSGDTVCAFFPDAGLVALDLNGSVKWQKDLGPFTSMHGIGASPLIVENRVVLLIDQLKDPFIVALELDSGKEVWRTARRPGITGAYSTPVTMQLDGQSVILCASPGELIGYDPATGEQQLSHPGVANAPVGTPTVVGNKIYLCEPVGEPIPMAALGNVDKNQDGVLELEEVKDSLGAYRLVERIDTGFGNGDGKVDKAEWDKGFGTFLKSGGMSCIEVKRQQGKFACQLHWNSGAATTYIPSLLVLEDRVVAVKDGGVLTSFNAQTGGLIKRRRLGDATGAYYASPVADSERLIVANADGKVSLVQADQELTPLSSVDLEEQIVATPMLHNGRLFVRTESLIYCFGIPKGTG